MSTSDEKTEAKLMKSTIGYAKALLLVLKTPGKPSHKTMEAWKKHSLAMVRYRLRLKLAEDQNDELLNAPIPNKGADYVAIYREEKLKALMQRYNIDQSSGNAHYSLSLQLATDFYPGFKTPPRQRSERPQWSATDGMVLIILINKIQSHSKTRRSILSLVREAKRKYPHVYGMYSDQTLKVRYFEALRQHNRYGKI
jgi:hypothetical protein